MNWAQATSLRQRGEILRRLDSENYYMIRNTDKSQVFAKYTADDNMYAVVRIDKADPTLREEYAGRIDHAHKETATDFKVKNNAGYTKRSTKYDDQGEISNDHQQTHIPIIINTPSNYEYRNTL